MLSGKAREFAQKIKDGTLVWEQTFDHPLYGDLTFKARLPVAADLQAHSVAIGNQLAGATAEPTLSAIRLAIGIAAIGTLIEPPVLDEERTYDEDSDEERVRKVLYDPGEDPIAEFPLKVWEPFAKWRDELLSPESLEALKNSSGETRGTGSSEPSIEPTASPLTTPA